MGVYTGKHIWIIGASSGIGKALAEELAWQGATLALSARRGDILQDNIDNLQGEGHLAMPLDVSNIDALRDGVETIQERFPRLDSVVFLAAIYSPHDGKKKEIDFIHQMINVNIGGAFNVVDAILPLFQKQGRGQIALCGSVAGYRGLAYGQPYCATKAAIMNYAESLKVELEPENIDVKLISPGFVKTPLTDKNDFPMPMMIEADDAAKAIAKGLEDKSFEIHFPKKFTWIMKVLRILPAPLYFFVSRKMLKT